MNILFVCTGNTCRSPIAEGVLRDMATRKGLPYVALSAGLRAFPGMPVSPESVDAARLLEPPVDISNHKARLLKPEYMEAADLVITMTDDLKIRVQQEFPAMMDKVYTLNEMAKEPGEVADPYGASLAIYEACAKQIQALIEKGLAFLESMNRLER